MSRTLSIFGATGSVGLSTLDLIRQNRDAYKIVALTANGNAADLAKLAIEFDAEIAVVADEAALPALNAALAGSTTKAAAGPAALIEAAQMGADWTMAAIVGCAGLPPTMAARGTCAPGLMAVPPSGICKTPADPRAIAATVRSVVRACEATPDGGNVRRHRPNSS